MIRALAILCVPALPALVALVAIPFYTAMSAPPQCVDAETRHAMIALMNEAIDSSFKNQVAFLFGVWMKDATAQPERARVGVYRAMHAYIQVRGTIAAWEPPECGVDGRVVP